jgi:DNA modification methylase
MRFTTDGRFDQSKSAAVRPVAQPASGDLRAAPAPRREPPSHVASVPSQTFSVDSVAQGDCVQVMRQIPAAGVDFILTDPPYLVNYHSRDGRAIQNDADSRWLKPSFVQAYRVLRPDRFCISFYGWSKADQFIAAWREAGFRLVGHLVFRKSYASSTRFLRYHHEQAYLLAKGNPAPPKHPIPDVLEMRYTGNKIHPTQKDISALLPLIECFSAEGDLVLDPFCGSGSTLVASRCLHRHFFGIELDPAYHALAVSRIAQTIFNGTSPEGSREKTNADQGSPRQARTSQKLTIESNPRAPIVDRQRQIQR